MAARRKNLAWITESLRPLAEDVGDLVVDPRNARRHSDANIAAIKASLLKYGQLHPLVVNRANSQIVAGNGRYAAALELGWTHVAVVWVEQDAAAQAGFALADNRTAELAAWDDALLAELISEVKADDVDLYDALLLAELLPTADVAAAPPQKMDRLEYEIVVACRDEKQQAELLQRFKDDGLHCRILKS